MNQIRARMSNLTIDDTASMIMSSYNAMRIVIYIPELPALLREPQISVDSLILTTMLITI